MNDPLRPNLLSDARAREEFDRLNRARDRRNTEDLKRRLAAQEATAVCEQRMRHASWDSILYGCVSVTNIAGAIHCFVRGEIRWGLAFILSVVAFVAMTLEARGKYRSARRDHDALQRSTRPR